MTDRSLLPAPAGPLVAARERAFRILTDRYADDTLALEEFERRLDLVYGAPSPAAVDAIVGDLPAAGDLAGERLQPRAGAGWSHPNVGVGTGGDGRGVGERGGRLLAVLAERRVSGGWPLPERLEIRALFAEVVLDLREVPLPADSTIDVSAAFAEVRLLVPEGVAVECRVGAVMASVDDRSVLPRGVPRAVVRVTGTVALAELGVRTVPRGVAADASFRQVWRRARRTNG